MKKSSGMLKKEAKSALKGRWKESVLLNIIPSILIILRIWLIVLVFGLVGLFFGSFVNEEYSDTSYDQEMTLNNDLDDLDYIDDDMLYNDISTFDESPVSTGATFGQGLFSIILGLIGLGISFTFLDMLRNPERKVSVMRDSFRIFNGKDFIPVFLIGLLQTIFVFLWTLLFIIPGIIKGYAYSQAFFIYKDKSEHEGAQNISAINYITESRQLMNGNKGRLFYIDLSFIGWHILAILTLGIGYLFLNPYIEMTKAAFYRDISKDQYLLNSDSLI